MDPAVITHVPGSTAVLDFQPIIEATTVNKTTIINILQNGLNKV